MAHGLSSVLVVTAWDVLIRSELLPRCRVCHDFAPASTAHAAAIGLLAPRLRVAYTVQLYRSLYFEYSIGMKINTVRKYSCTTRVRYNVQYCIEYVA